MRIKNECLVSINKSKDIKNGTVVIPDSVTSIGPRVFLGCSKLISIKIPDTVKTIRIGAFSYCNNLTNITITDSVTNIGAFVFAGCSSLKNITIPNSVTNIGAFAFAGCSSLTSVTIPDSVVNIGDEAFRDCSSLTSIEIPNSLTSIGDLAFSDCSSLTSITVLKNNITYKSIDGNLYSKDGKVFILYAIGKSSTEFTIPSHVTSIGNGAFYDCNSLKSVTIPDSVTSIGNFAFYGCRKLTSVNIPDSVTSIGDSAFNGHNKLILPINVEKIKAVKGFALQNGNLECKGFKFKVDKEYKEDSASLCTRGFHACTNGADVFNYYSGPDVAYYEIELSGISPDRGDDSKICGKEIKLLRKLTVAEAANYRSEFTIE